MFVVIFQLLYVRWATHIWSLDDYGSATFKLSQGDELNVLFSYNHGLFLWYPVLVPMLAVALWQRKSRNWGWIALASVALVTIVYGSWNPWFLAGAMGARGFVDIVPIISVAGGLGLAQLRPNRRVLVFAPAVVLSWVTVEPTAGYWTGVLPFDNNTAAQFWAAGRGLARDAAAAEAPGWRDALRDFLTGDKGPKRSRLPVSPAHLGLSKGARPQPVGRVGLVAPTRPANVPLWFDQQPHGSRRVLE